MHDRLRGSGASQHREGSLDRLCAGSQRQIGVHGQLVSHLGQLLRWQQRRQPAFYHIDQAGSGERAGDGLHLLPSAGRFHEDHVRPGGDVGSRPLEGAFQTLHRQRVGAGHQHQVGVLTRHGRRYELLHHLLDGDHTLPGEVPTALGGDLILQRHGRHPRALHVAHRAQHVEVVAIAGVRVGNHRDLNRLGDISRHAHDLGHGGQSDVRHAQHGVGDAGAGGEDHPEPSLFCQLGVEGVGDARGDQDSRLLQELAQAAAWILRHGRTLP